ncbi:hypothetical protein K3495_g11826 [Podosphaera aphanis]|nr:hypothetical protein K3495_g11826 [Podosphaera aphanis]
MTLYVPPEILHLVCDQLGYQRDFVTLFACALTGKLLARVALQWLYRIHSYSKILFRGSNYNDIYLRDEFGMSSISRDRFPDDDGLSYSERMEKIYQPKRIRLWKSIMLSIIRKTAYPYCLFIHTLDLDKLTFLISSLRRDNILSSFFEADMSAFIRYHPNSRGATLSPEQSLRFIDSSEVAEFLGDSLLSYINEVIIQQPRVVVNLECIRWNNQRGGMTRWTSQWPKIKSLEITFIKSSNLHLAKAISDNCPEFNSLKLSVFDNKQIDRDLSRFLRGLKQNTLQTLLVFQNGGRMKDQALLSLNHHADSLRKLNFCRLNVDAYKKLHLLRPCKNISSLQISFVYGEADYYFELKKEDSNLFQAVMNWICSCRNLRELSVGSGNDGMAIVTEVCSKDWIQLQKLEILKVDMSVPYNKHFFRALSLQTTLEHLHLLVKNVDYEEEDPREEGIICFRASLCCLTNLKYLDISPEFGFYYMETILILASHLLKLEEFIFTCHDTNDRLWPLMTNLRNLRVLTINGISYFTFGGILTYIDSLQHSNKGLELSVMAQEEDKPIAEQEISIISQSIRAKVGGCFAIEHYSDYMMGFNRDSCYDGF